MGTSNTSGRLPSGVGCEKLADADAATRVGLADLEPGSGRRRKMRGNSGTTRAFTFRRYSSTSSAVANGYAEGFDAMPRRESLHPALEAEGLRNLGSFARTRATSASPSACTSSGVRSSVVLARIWLR